jgi:hypothetical protein
MISLFDREENFSWQAMQIEREMENLLEPIVEKYARLGYSTRELEYIINGAAGFVCLHHRGEFTSKQEAKNE